MPTMVLGFYRASASPIMLVLELSLFNSRRRKPSVRSDLNHRLPPAASEEGFLMNCFASRVRQLKSLALVSFCCLVISSRGAIAAEPLVWKFVEGDTYRYQMIQEMESTMDLGPGGATTSTVKQTIDMTWEINSVEETGTADLTQTIDRVQMEITAPGQGEVHFDTASEEPAQGFSAMLAPSLKAMTKSPFKVTMTIRGEITAVEIPEALIETMSQGSGEALLGSLVTEEGFKKTIAQSSIILPTPEELVEGHQWTTSFEMDSPAAGKVVTETTYEYQGSREIEGQQMEVFLPTLKTRFAEGIQPNGATISVTSQETTGEILFNRSVGRLESTSIHQLIDMMVTVGDTEVNQRINQTISFRATKDK